LLLVVIIVTEDKEKTNQKEKNMVILRQQSEFVSEFVISGDIEKIKAELAKGKSDKPDENSQGVFLGKFEITIFWDNGDSLTVPDLEIRLNRGHIGVIFPPYSYFFKEEDEELYDNVIDYITHIAMEELSKI
jgi:hypothetical protein